MDMGYSSAVHSFGLTACFICSLLVSKVPSAQALPLDYAGQPPPPATVLSNLGLSKAPDTKRMNVSQEEYSRMFNLYLRRLKHNDSSSSYYNHQFHVFKHSGSSDPTEHSSHGLHFPSQFAGEKSVVMANARMFISSPSFQEPELLVYDSSSHGDPFLIDHKRFDSSRLPKWIDIDVTGRNITDLRLTIECVKCKVQVSQPVLNVLTTHGEGRRGKRHAQTYKSECYAGAKKKKCCRHQMDVVFKELPGYDFIVAPYHFDAGYCKGGCPYRFNPANHHSTLQSLIRKLDPSAAPKSCCAPSKLRKLEILHLDENDPGKLQMATWSDMIVLECACF